MDRCSYLSLTKGVYGDPSMIAEELETAATVRAAGKKEKAREHGVRRAPRTGCATSHTQ